MEPVRLDHLVPKLQDRFAPMLDQKQLALETVIESPATIRADTAMVSTAISNLMDNAVEGLAFEIRFPAAEGRKPG